MVMRKENFCKAEGLTEAGEICIEDLASFDDYFAEYDTHPDTKAK